MEKQEGDSKKRELQTTRVIHSEYCACGVEDISELEGIYSHVKSFFRGTPYNVQLEKTFSLAVSHQKNIKLDRMIVFCLGSLVCLADCGHIHCHTKDPLCQLAVLESYLELLGNHSVKVFLQDPDFTAIDQEFLQSVLGFTVVENPTAQALISDTSFVYVPYAPFNLKHALLYCGAPAILVIQRIQSVGGLPDRWCAVQDNVSSYYQKRNFQSLGTLSCWSPYFDGDEPLLWLDGMSIFYPVEDPYGPNVGCNSLTEEEIKSLKVYNSSNYLLCTWYSTLPFGMTLQEALDDSDDPEWVLIEGLGTWSNDGFTFDEDFLANRNTMVQEAEALADRIAIKFENGSKVKPANKAQKTNESSHHDPMTQQAGESSTTTKT